MVTNSVYGQRSEFRQYSAHLRFNSSEMNDILKKRLNCWYGQVTYLTGSRAFWNVHKDREASRHQAEVKRSRTCPVSETTEETSIKFDMEDGRFTL
jgi:hypothetical protein